jgi:hypothetical protein
MPSVYVIVCVSAGTSVNISVSIRAGTSHSTDVVIVIGVIAGAVYSASAGTVVVSIYQ